MSCLRAQIQDTVTFEQVDIRREQVLRSHAEFNQEHGFEHRNNLPYLYEVFKPAKKSFRWIAGVGKEEGPREGRKLSVPKRPRPSLHEAAALAVELLKVTGHLGSTIHGRQAFQGLSGKATASMDKLGR